jgi:rhodanese-related sulfurtransferase
MSPKSKQTALVAAIILAGGALPVILYGLVVGRVPTVTPEEAKAWLSRSDADALLVDVRPAETFAESHLDGAVNWPYDAITSLRSRQDVPEPFRGKTLLLICESGVYGALATSRLERLGLESVRNVRGGMQAWVADARSPCPLALATLRDSSGRTTKLPFREAPAYEQWAAFVVGFVVKPFYMLLALVIVAILWRRRSPELAALRWGLIFFFIGEAFCAANYLAYEDQSFLFEYLHSFGMVLCFGFATYAAFEGMDRWLIRYSDLKETCAALPLCCKCIKYADVPCGLRRTFYVLIPATLVLAFMPLLAQPVTPSYNTRILGTFYNYSHPVIYQIYEIRYLPMAAIAALTASLLVLLLKKTDPVSWSKMLFAVGMGALGFSLMRLLILAPYGDNQVWFAFWEEITELMFVAGAGIVLWIFRPGLFPRKEAA